MAQLTETQQEVADQRQSLLYYHRERRKSILDPTFKLFKTHEYTVADNPINTSDAFPLPRAEITCKFSAVRDDIAATGTFFELGGTPRGIAAAIDGADLIVCGGEQAGSDEGVDIRMTDFFPVNGQEYDVCIAVVAQLGAVQVWRDGQLVGSGVSIDGDMGNGGTNNGSNGAIATVAGTVVDRIPLAQRVALSDARITSPWSGYFKQFPRQFEVYSLGTDNGFGSYTVAV